MTRTDAELLERIAARDRAAFAAFYDRYAARVFGLILHILRNRPDAEDVLQEAFLQVWHQSDRFDPGRASAEAWVLLIARSRAVDRIRRRSIEPAVAVAAEPAETPDPAADLVRIEDAGQLNTALDALPAEQREPIRLAFFAGLTHDQVSRVLGLPLGTVKTRIRLGMIRLRDRIAPPSERSRP